MHDPDLMSEEVKKAARDGNIACIVEAGHAEMGRDINFIRQVAMKSGVPIVVGGGFYSQPFYPKEISTMSEDQIFKALIKQVDDDVASQGLSRPGECARRRSGRNDVMTDSGFPRPLSDPESDGLPGLIVDRYFNHFSVQTLTLAMDQRKELIRDALVEIFAPQSIILRNDSPSRKAEGMEPCIELLYGENPGSFQVEANGLKFEVDLLDGQKTGLYLDQLQSHAEVAALAKGKRVLDCFTNQGGFALACAKAGAAKVTAIDVSASACAAARKNAELNGLEIEVLEHNVFDFLKHAAPEYDLIILDPPSFTRNKKTLMDAMRGYKEIHLRSLKLLEKGGILSTFCCSHHASRELFLDNLVDASVDAKKSLRLVREHGQRPDHPILISIPETGYLKGFTVEVIATR